MWLHLQLHHFTTAQKKILLTTHPYFYSLCKKNNTLNKTGQLQTCLACFAMHTFVLQYPENYIPFHHTPAASSRFLRCGCICWGNSLVGWSFLVEKAQAIFFELYTHYTWKIICVAWPGNDCTIINILKLFEVIFAIFYLPFSFVRLNSAQFLIG